MRRGGAARDQPGRKSSQRRHRLILTFEVTKMRLRPVRPNIYLPVVRFGVVVSDWKYILCVTLVGYLVPFFFRLKVGNVPLWFVTGIGAAALSYCFFRYTKIGRKSFWFQHSMRAIYEGPIARRAIPRDRKPCARPWLIQN